MPKARPTILYPKLKWEVDPRALCPCGSGLLFRKCCRENEGLADESTKFFRASNYESAERACRAELTRYSGWIFQHTLVLVQRKPSAAAALVQIDVDALENIADRLAWALHKQNKREAILHTFDHLAKSIPLPLLAERMAYLKCLWLIHIFGEPASANKILEKWPSHEDIKDIRLLQIYCEVRGDSIAPRKCIEIAGRIIEQTKSTTEKLQYSLVKATMVAILGEIDEARKVHTDALGLYLASAADAAKDGDLYACLFCARALEFQGMLNDDSTAFERALVFLNKVALDDLTAEGASEVLYEKGLLLLHKGSDLEAIDALTKAYDQSPTILSLIYRLEAFTRVNNLIRAKEDLGTLERAQIPESCKLEYYRSAASFSVSSGDAMAARIICRSSKY